MRRLKKGDRVIVITGDDKGKIGRIESISAEKVLVEGVNIVKKVIKKGMLGQNQTGTIVEVEAPFNISNAMLVCSSCNKPTRVGYATKDGKKSRVCKKCGALIDLSNKFKRVKNVETLKTDKTKGKGKVNKVKTE